VKGRKPSCGSGGNEGGNARRTDGHRLDRQNIARENGPDCNPARQEVS
jgi:hypothetical protein